MSNDFLGDFYSRHWQESISPKNYRCLIDDKLILNSYLKDSGLPAPSTLAVLGANIPNIHETILNSWEEFRTWISLGQEDIFIKPVSGICGAGALSLGKIVDNHSLKWQQLPLDTSIDLRGIKRHISESNYYNFIIQKRLLPSKQLSSFSENVLQTVRILTLYSKNNVSVIAAALKISSGLSPVDNLLAGKNLIAPVDLETGTLGRAVYLRGDQPRYTDVHPISSAPIKGVRIDHWDDIIAVTQKAARCFPWFRSIGWDIAITEDGPVIIEPNYWSDMGLLQLSHRRGMLSWPEFRSFFYRHGLHRYISLGLTRSKSIGNK